MTPSLPLQRKESGSGILTRSVGSLQSISRSAARTIFSEFKRGLFASLSIPPKAIFLITFFYFLQRILGGDYFWIALCAEVSIDLLGYQRVKQLIGEDTASSSAKVQGGNAGTPNDGKKPKRCLSFLQWLIRLSISRALAWWLLWSGAVDLPYDLWWFIFPLFLCWYLFEPLFALSGKSFGDRLDYFISRYPYFTGYGLITSITLFLSHNDLFLTGLELPLLISLIFSSAVSTEDRPKYTRYLPYTPETFTVDPLDLLDGVVHGVVLKE